MKKIFLILQPSYKIKCDIKSIPYEIVAPYDDNAIKYHGQSLERLNQRGGLSPLELYCVINDVSFYKTQMTETSAIEWLKKLLEENKE